MFRSVIYPALTFMYGEDDPVPFFLCEQSVLASFIEKTLLSPTAPNHLCHKSGVHSICSALLCSQALHSVSRICLSPSARVLDRFESYCFVVEQFLLPCYCSSRVSWLFLVPSINIFISACQVPQTDLLGSSLECLNSVRSFGGELSMS